MNSTSQEELQRLYVAEGKTMKEISDDNRIENLKVMTKKEHMSYHMRLRNAKKRGEDL